MDRVRDRDEGVDKMTLVTRAGVLHPAEVVQDVPGCVVTVRGRLDVHTIADVRMALHDVVDRGQGDLVIHLAEAEVGDATGLGVIVGVHHRARRAGRRLVIADSSPRLDRLLCATRLTRVLARPIDPALVATPLAI